MINLTGEFSEDQKLIRSLGVYTLTLDVEVFFIFWLTHWVSACNENAIILDCGSMFGMTALTMASAMVRANKSFGKSGRIISIEQDKERYEKCIDIAHQIDISNIVTFINGSDVDYLDRIEDNSINMVYHDSNHSYGHLTKGLELSLEKVKPQGCISGHDYFYMEQDIIKAVEHWKEQNKDKITGFSTYFSVWWVINGGS